MKEKNEITKEVFVPKQSTLNFLKGFSAQFFSVYSKDLGQIFVSNN